MLYPVLMATGLHYQDVYQVGIQHLVNLVVTDNSHGKGYFSMQTCKFYSGSYLCLFLVEIATSYFLLFLW